jgi:hypothetical protein
MTPRANTARQARTAAGHDLFLCQKRITEKKHKKVIRGLSTKIPDSILIN